MKQKAAEPVAEKQKVKPVTVWYVLYIAITTRWSHCTLYRKALRNEPFCDTIARKASFRHHYSIVQYAHTVGTQFDFSCDFSQIVLCVCLAYAFFKKKKNVLHYLVCPQGDNTGPDHCFTVEK